MFLTFTSHRFSSQCLPPSLSHRITLFYSFYFSWYFPFKMSLLISHVFFLILHSKLSTAKYHIRHFPFFFSVIILLVKSNKTAWSHLHAFSSNVCNTKMSFFKRIDTTRIVHENLFSFLLISDECLDKHLKQKVNLSKKNHYLSVFFFQVNIMHWPLIRRCITFKNSRNFKVVDPNV